jgi:3-methyladenine DNA glycosylase AlkD
MWIQRVQACPSDRLYFSIMLQAQRDLRKLSSPRKAQNSLRFFKTGPGQYGEGDQFIGVTVPELRGVAKLHFALGMKDIATLLRSPIHEDRLLALVVLVNQYSKTTELRERRRLFEFYLKNRSGIDNWDLVDSSAASIVGAYSLETGDPTMIRKLAKSKRHWDRRIAMVATFAYIRNRELSLVWELATLFLGDREDLMHKATGWMMREAGKRDAAALRKFISSKGSRMPRTMLRYAIEKFSARERALILLGTRKPK